VDKSGVSKQQPASRLLHASGPDLSLGARFTLDFPSKLVAITGRTTTTSMRRLIAGWFGLGFRTRLTADIHR
jgi:hypothetical protein